jgi:hypothetical protein
MRHLPPTWRLTVYLTLTAVIAALIIGATT